MSNSFNTKQAAEFLGISRVSVYRLTNYGNLPHQRIGSRILFDPDVLREWKVNNPIVKIPNPWARNTLSFGD